MIPPPQLTLGPSLKLDLALSTSLASSRLSSPFTAVKAKAVAFFLCTTVPNLALPYSIKEECRFSLCGRVGVARFMQIHAILTQVL